LGGTSVIPEIETSVANIESRNLIVDLYLFCAFFLQIINNTDNIGV
jgi:hypothetical protein